MKDSKDEGTIDWVSEIGLTPRGTPMPQTIEEWKHLGDLYEAALLHEKNINSRLRAEINGYKQKLAVYKREKAYDSINKS